MPAFAWDSRKSKRVRFEAPAYFRLNRSSKKELRLNSKNMLGKMIDLSVDGCSFESALFLPVGVRINIFFDKSQLLPAGQKKDGLRFCRITGVVRNSRPLANRKFRMGIQMDRLFSGDQKLIHAFVERQKFEAGVA